MKVDKQDRYFCEESWRNYSNGFLIIVVFPQIIRAKNPPKEIPAICYNTPYLKSEGAETRHTWQSAANFHRPTGISSTFVEVTLSPSDKRIEKN